MGKGNAYQREVAAWAAAHGWAYRKGMGGRTWTESLPGGSNAGVDLQVDGAHHGRAFTLVSTSPVMVGTAFVQVESTVTIVHLPSAYPAAKIQPRTMFNPRRSFGTIGHAAFDKRFRVRTRAPGGPAAVVCTQLAEAHVAGIVPLWSLRNHELMCYTWEKTPAEDLDAAVDKAIFVADLLGIPRDRAVLRSGHSGSQMQAGEADQAMDDRRHAHIRVSDAEREQALSTLAVHLSTGRLELAEFDDRCGRAAAARTRADVELLFEDLPLPHPDLRSATRPTAPMRGQFVGTEADATPSKSSSNPTADTIAGLTCLIGIPGTIVLSIQLEAWWPLLLILGLFWLVGKLPARR